MWREDVFNRAVKNFKIRVEEFPDKKWHVFVTTLDREPIETFLASSREEAEDELRQRGYVRIPWFVAHGMNHHLPIS